MSGSDAHGDIPLEFWHKRDKRWQAYGQLNGKLHRLGYFTSENEAAEVAKRWREQHLPPSID